MEREGENVFNIYTYENFHIDFCMYTHKEVRWVTIMQQTSRSRTSNRLRISGLSNWALVALTAVSRIPVRLCWYKVVAGRASSGLVVMKQTVMAHYWDILQQQFGNNCNAQWNTFWQIFKTSHITLCLNHNQWPKYLSRICLLICSYTSELQQGVTLSSFNANNLKLLRLLA